MSESLNDALARLAGQMKSVTEITPRFRGMLYGRSGSGKTVLAAKILKTICPPKTGILYIDTSEGFVSLKNHEDEGLTKNVKRVPFTTIEDIRIIGQAIKHKQGMFAYVSGVVLDEGSSMAGIDTDRLYEARKASDPRVDSLTPEWPDYHAALQRFRVMSAELHDIEGLHVITVAHVSEKKDTRGNIIHMFPSFSPKIAEKVKEPLHLVGYCSAVHTPDAESEVKYHREVQVNPTNFIDAKTRLPIPQLRVLQDDLPGLVKAWLDAGGVPVEADDTPREDPDESKDLTGLTKEEALEKVDSTVDDDDLTGLEDIFQSVE